MNISSRECRLLAIAAIITGLQLSSSLDVQAQSPLENYIKRRDAQPGRNPKVNLGARPGEPTTRLSFFNSSWASVLRKVAESTKTTLVMDRVPPGRFTRRDSRDYSLDNAILILNRELEKDAFRLIRKGDFLIVLELKAARSEYYRNEAPAQNSQKPAAKSAEVQGKSTIQRYQRSFERLALPDSNQTSPANRQTSGQNSIHQTSHESRAEEHPISKLADEHNRDGSDVQVIKRIKTRHSARDIARTIFSAFRDRAQLVESGPLGLPAFRVLKESLRDRELLLPDEEPDEQFAIGIDVDGNHLVVSAAGSAAIETVRLVTALDVMKLQKGQDFKLVSASDKQIAIAQQIRPQVGRLIAQAPAAAQPPAATSGVLTEDEASILLDSLRGNVDIEVVPGGLILKGNQADIDSLMRVINQIETFSRGAVPSIHIVLLKNVNSEALSTLMASVYQQLNTLQARGGTLPERIAFLPVVRPNALIVLAPETDMEAIIELADELDQPLDPESEFEVFYLRYAIASLVATRLNDFYGQQTPGQTNQNLVGLTQRVTAVADTRTNSVVVRGRANDLVEVASLITKLDRADSQTVNRVQMFVLKNAVAEEMANVINTTIQAVLGPPGQQTGSTAGGLGAATGQIPEDLQEAKSVVLEFLNDSEAGVEMVRSGLLSDIRVSIDARTNALIVTAPEASMPLMESLIRRLDKPSATIAEIKVFTLENADATGMAELLDNLFNQGDGDDESGLQVQIAGAEDASSSLVPLRFSVDVRTNTIVAVGGAEALRVVEAILLRLDQSDMRLRQSTVMRLKNAPVADVSTAINQFLTSQRELAQLDAELVSNVELLEQEVIVVPEVINNSLLISATPRYYDSIMELILKLDDAPAQVIIQALLVEVELDNTDEFGVELGFQDSVLFNRSLIPQDTLTTISQTITELGIQNTSQEVISAEASPGFGFNSTATGLGNNVGPAAPFNKGRVGTQGLSNFSLGRFNSDLGYGGLVLAASSDSVNVLLRALSAQRTVNVLSRPQIRTIDGQFSQIVVGQTIQWIQGFQPGGVTGQFTPLTAEKNIGIILQVTPRISPDGTIVMETHAEKSQISPDEAVPLIFDPVSQTQIESPVIDVTIADTTVAVPTGQTAVIGGMITTNNSTVERKVPWLGDIPVLGMPFRFDSSTSQRTELLIFMTPRIIHNDEDAEMIKQIESERLHFIVEDAESVHGPLFSLPAGSGESLDMSPNRNPPPAPALMPDTNDKGVPSSSITPRNVPRLMPVQSSSKDTQNDLRERPAQGRKIIPVSQTESRMENAPEPEKKSRWSRFFSRPKRTVARKSAVPGEQGEVETQK